MEYGKVVFLFPRHTLIWCLLLSLSAGCKAQSPPAGATSNSAAPVPASQLNRRIEVLVRSQFEVPPNVEVAIGTPAKSEFPGYQSLPITFSSNGKQTIVNFLLSNDGNTVARLEKFDISHSPSDTITTQNRPIRGTPEAKVTIVNFDDLECPYCARLHASIFPAITARDGNSVRIVYKDFPLDQHPWAMRASVDVNCLGEQSAAGYWNAVDYIHAHSSEIGQPATPAEAAKDKDKAPEGERTLERANSQLDKLVFDQGAFQKVDLAKLNACVLKQDTAAILASRKVGEGLGVDSTPSLFVNGEKLDGAVPLEFIFAEIDESLRAAGATPPAPYVPPAPPTPPATAKPAGATAPADK